MCWRFSLLGLIALAACSAVQPAPRGAVPAPLRRAEAAVERSDYREAVAIYAAFLESDPPQEFVAQAMYKLALSQFRLGRHAEALQTLERLRARFPGGRWVQVWTLSGDIEQARGNRVTALTWWDGAWAVAASGERGQLSARIIGLVRSLSDPERRHARRLAATAFVRRALDEQPRSPDAAIPAARAPSESAARSAALGADSARIGVLLPLSGEHAAFGERSLDGIRAALGGDESRLVVRDTGGTAARGLAAMNELAADATVVAVIGPLLSRVAAAVAPQASRAGLPMLLLSQREGLVDAVVLQTAMTASMQADALADYAVRTLALTHVAILRPADLYGQRMAAALRRAARAQAAHIVTEASYAPGGWDVGAAVAQLQREDARARIDAVFIPDSAEAAAVVAPEVRGVLPHARLLGTADWNNPFALQRGAGAIDGAVFVDGFFADSARAATRNFVGEFARRFGHRPGILEAQAHDAAALAAAAVGRGGRSRADLGRLLREFGVFEGAAGTLELSGGRVRRQLFLMTVSDGQLRELAR